MCWLTFPQSAKDLPSLLPHPQEFSTLSELQVGDNKTFLHADCKDHMAENLLLQWVKCFMLNMVRFMLKLVRFLESFPDHLRSESILKLLKRLHSIISVSLSRF